MNHIYIGWGNQRIAYGLRNKPCAVLVKGGEFTALVGDQAKEFKSQVSKLSLHLCGIEHSAFARDLLAQVEGDDRHDVKAYNIIFDQFWSPLS